MVTQCRKASEEKPECRMPQCHIAEITQCRNWKFTCQSSLNDVTTRDKQPAKLGRM